MKTVLSVAFLPPIEYFLIALKSDELWIEAAENYQKQTYRNRCNILTANGTLPLAVPVCHGNPKIVIRDVRIDYKTDWQRKHWKAIESAYNGSPFFQYYADFFIPFFQKKQEFLFDYNINILKVINKLLEINQDFFLTENYVKQDEDLLDYRQIIHPKRCNEENYALRIISPYPQVFDHKFGFTPNLSILDLLFNLGNESREYLNNQSIT